MNDIRVLLVDDQELFREGVRVIVDAQEGMEVVGAAGDGLEAVQLVDELEPDVVLMDIRMPEMDGVEATRQIFQPERVARRSQRPVRVIVLTTFNLDDKAATAIRHGASGFLLKDTTPVMLRDAIRTVHGGNAVIAPADLSALLDLQFREVSPPPAAYLSSPTRSARCSTHVARGLSNTEIAGAGLRRRVDGEDPRRRDPAQAGAARPRADRGVRPPARAGAVGLTPSGAG